LEEAEIGKVTYARKKQLLMTIAGQKLKFALDCGAEIGSVTLL